ncbi:hypothetical protein C7M84_008099 [Penaeus vannamei]|uniref:Uncharacterized protein n=1 Tax=Penaeus vannamei TaxID=6689 RepID=A0A3R7SSR7_PENVA|nr:hypothetical protein C7M84_008099 [Penaeus vannamei]
MDWLCCFCRPTESEDLSRETEGILREGDTAEPSDSVPAAVSDPFRRGDDPALNEPSGAVRSAVSSRSSSEGCLDERRPPAVDRPSSTPTGGLEVSRCVVDGRSPPSPSPFFSSVIDGPSSTSVPPHESLASPTLSGIKPDVRQLPSPATSKPSASAAPQSGLFQSFAQTPFSQERNPCARASCLYNKPGRLCTIFDQRYVYIGHKDTFILVELKRRISCGLLLGTRLVWKQRKPHLLSDLADGANVVCDALSLPDTHGFHALVVWQGTKPNLIEEPAEEGEVMMLERYDLQVTGIEASEGGGGSMDVDIKGKSLKVKFMEEVKSVLITYDVLYINGQRIPATDTVANYSEKGSTVSVAAVPLVPPCQVLGVTVTHKALAAWQGTKPECVEEIVEAYASGSDVQPGTRVIPETEIQRSVSCDRVTNSAPSLHQNHAATENLSESCCVEYIAAYRWKIAGISQGLLCRKSRVVLVKHEVFFVNKLRVPNTDPLSKFADIESKESFVNALVVPVSSPQVILGHNVTHEALVAWCGKKPDEANSYVEEYSKEKGKRSHTPNSPMKTSSLQEIGNTTRALPNPTDGKISSTEKMKFSGKDETKGSVSAVVASGLPKAKPTANNRKPEPTPKKKVPDKQPQKKTKPRHGQGKLQKVVGDHGILEIRCKNIEGERAMVAFHRSVTFLYQRRVDPKKGLEEQLSPHQADGKDFFCHFIDHGMNMGGVACQYKATMVWLGTKPKTVKEQAAETRVDKSQSTEKNNKATGVLRIQNAAGTLAHATSQVAVLKVNNVALKDGTAFVFVKGTDVYVHQRRLQDASEMTRHLIWQCNIRAWKKPSTPVKGFVCHYQAELAWVGKRPKRDDGKSSADNSQEGPVKAKKIPLLPTPGLPRIENAQTTLVYVKGQRAVLRVNNMTKLPLYASAHYTNAYVLREKVQNPNDMLRHNHWNCNLKKCDQSGLSVDGFVYQYEAELAWVGERPSQGGKDGGSQTSLGEGLESLSSMYEDLFPVIGPEDNTKIVNL